MKTAPTRGQYSCLGFAIRMASGLYRNAYLTTTAVFTPLRLIRRMAMDFSRTKFTKISDDLPNYQIVFPIRGLRHGKGALSVSRRVAESS